MSGKTRRFSPEEKLEIITMVIKEPKKMREILGRHDIGRATFYKWRNRFLQGGKEELKDYKTGPYGEKKPTTREKELAQQLAVAQKRIDELAVELEVVKKKRKLLGLE